MQLKSPWLKPQTFFVKDWGNIEPLNLPWLLFYRYVIQNLTAKLNFMYTIHYEDELGAQRLFHSVEELDLLVN